jgi:uncharacterized membrane protein YfcA
MSAFILYAFAGAGAGVIAGLFGVGGGLLMVPVLVWSFQANQFSPEISVHLAVGTSLAIIVVTSLSSIVAHQRKGAVLWSIVQKLAPGLLIGSLIGAFVAKQLPSAWLGRSFGVFTLLIALQMAFQHARPILTSSGETVQTSLLEMFGVGALIGGLSSILGIGGGSLTVPFLTHRHLSMQRAVGTAAVCGLPIALAGAVGFILIGQDVTQLPQGSMGYLYLPAFLGMALFSLLTAPFGAALAHRLKDLQLRRFFSIFLMLMGLKMLLI